MIGFAVFTFEGQGISCLLPIVNEAKDPSQVPKLIIIALSALCVIKITFAASCYYTWGSEVTDQAVIEMLPDNNYAVDVTGILFCLGLLC